MTNKEREQLKNEINYRNIMTKRLGRNAKLFFMIFLLTAALSIWGFFDLHDNFMDVSDSLRNVIKWVSIVVAVPTGVLSIMFFLSFRNSKKYVLALIDKLQGK